MMCSFPKQIWTNKLFSIAEEYQPLIEDIVKDGRLYNSYQHQHILKVRNELDESTLLYNTK